MKIRSGFVSNSSSSSFLIYGTSVEVYNFSDSELETIKERFIIILKGYNGKNENDKKWSKELIDELESVDIEDFKDNLNEYLETIVDYNEESLFIDYGEDIVSIGRSPENANNDLTFGEWKKNIENDVKFLFPSLDNFHWIEDCSYDG